jgi:hypothetical protein
MFEFLPHAAVLPVISTDAAHITWLDVALSLDATDNYPPLPPKANLQVNGLGGGLQLDGADNYPPLPPKASVQVSGLDVGLALDATDNYPPLPPK